MNTIVKSRGCNFIIEEGDETTTSGTTATWHYRKWSSGKVEAWTKVSWTISSWTNWNNTGFYYSNNSGSVYFPSVFTDIPGYIMQGSVSSGDSWIASGARANVANNYTPPIYVMRASTGNTNITATAYIYAYSLGN